jgi:hypothetical protein
MPEVVCEFLDLPRFRQEAEYVFGVLEEQPDDVLELQWAFGTDPESYEPCRVSALEIRKFIVDAAEHGVYEWGWADVFIRRLDDDLQIRLCHETDIHIQTNKESWIKHFTDRWLDVGITWWRKDTNESEWVKFP